MNIWLHAVRPRTLVAGAAPVVLGSALAWADGVFDTLTGAVALVCALLIQIASNFINDVEDFRRGADAHRVGPLRAVSAGLITPGAMRRAAIGVVVVAFLLGQILVARAGWPVLAIGSVSLLMAWMYTGGPFPLAYRGLGDVFAFVFFGVVAVCGTYYVHATTWSVDAFALSVGPGLLAANILAVNNIRDIVTDAQVGKRTLAVRIGIGPARFLYTSCGVLALVLPSTFLQAGRGPFLLLPLIMLPVTMILSVQVWRREGASLNPMLGGTAVMYVAYTVVMAVALVGARYLRP